MADYKDDSKTVTRVLSSTTHEPADTPDGRVKEGAWIRFLTFLHWYPKDMPSEEKKLILRLDLSILIFGCLSFFTKYLDQASLTNAYVRFVLPFDFLPLLNYANNSSPVA